MFFPVGLLFFLAEKIRVVYRSLVRVVEAVGCVCVILVMWKLWVSCLFVGERYKGRDVHRVVLVVVRYVVCRGNVQ